MVIRGEPCTIFFDKNMRYFIIAPVRNKQEFADRPGRYDHIIDLPEISAPVTAATGSPQSTKKDPPPPPSNAWTFFMHETWHVMSEENPNISFGEVSKEASRQWKAMPVKDKQFYQKMASEMTEQHKSEYGDHSSKPGKK